MLDLPTTLHPAGGRAPVRFAVPGAVVPIDLDDPESAAAQLVARARIALPGATSEQLAAVVAARWLLVDGLRAAGTGWAGTCVARSDADPERLTVALLTASVLDVGPGEAPAEAVAATLAAQAPRRVAEVVALPAGDSVVVVEDRTVGAPGSAGTGGVRQMQVLIAVDPGRLLVLGIATACTADWDAWLEVLAVIARSVGTT